MFNTEAHPFPKFDIPKVFKDQVGWKRLPRDENGLVQVQEKEKEEPVVVVETKVVVGEKPPPVVRENPVVGGERPVVVEETIVKKVEMKEGMQSV